MTSPWLFLVKVRTIPSGVRSAFQARLPSGVFTERKSVRVSVGELNPLEAISTATSRGTIRTVPPAGSPGISV